jgi:NADPH2:quinone reductase
MRALLARPSARHGLELGETGPPRPRPGEALVGVRAVSLNRGEARYLPTRGRGPCPAGYADRRHPQLA